MGIGKYIKDAGKGFVKDIKEKRSFEKKLKRKEELLTREARMKEVETLAKQKASERRKEVFKRYKQSLQPRDRNYSSPFGSMFATTTPQPQIITSPKRKRVKGKKRKVAKVKYKYIKQQPTQPQPSAHYDIMGGGFR